MHHVGGSILTHREHLAREWDSFRAVEAGRAAHLCRVWEAARPVVVVGRNTAIDDHVIQGSCHADGVDVLRRCSGGGAVVLAPGCLNYAVVLSLVSRPELMDVAASVRIILDQLLAALDHPGLSFAGESDLSLHGRKVSGNAQRRGRRALIHHGTLLYAFDATLAARYLKEPARQPTYREARPHTEFMGNLPLPRESVRARLESALQGIG
jgi:lipoate-protein ligase A